MSTLDKKIIEGQTEELKQKMFEELNAVLSALASEKNYSKKPMLKNAVMLNVRSWVDKVIKQVRADRDKESHCNCVEHYVGKRNKGYWIKARDGKEKRG